MKPFRRLYSAAGNALFATLLLVPGALQASVSETIDNAAPAAGSVDDLAGPIEVAFPEAVEKPPGVWENLEQIIADQPPFWADMSLAANLRSYYFYRDNVGPIPTNEAWAAGGTLRFESGKILERFSLGGEYFLSAPLHAPDSKPGTGLLEPVQDSISVMGQGFVRAQVGEQVFTVGRQRIEKPFLNGNDSRMLPNTFEAITWDGRWRAGRFFFGYVDRIKVRNSEKFIAMGQRAGVADSNEGLWELGARYEWGDGNYVGAIASIVPDILATTYSELDLRWASGEWKFRLGAQIADQRSIGDELLPGPGFDTQMVGARISASIDNLVLTGVVTTVADGAAFFSPFGGYPGFNAMMLSDFNLANQSTYRIGLSMRGDRFGVPWLSGFVNYARANGAELAAIGRGIPDDKEIDLTLDFKPGARSFQGVWLRLRYGIINPGNDRERFNIRATLNWPINLI